MGTVSGVGGQPSQSDVKLSKLRTRHANLNFKVFKEYMSMYEVSGDETQASIARFGQQMNDSNNMDKKTWLNLIMAMRHAKQLVDAKREVFVI